MTSYDVRLIILSMTPDLQRRVETARTIHRQRPKHKPIKKDNKGRLLEDIIYGANDGIITTFAIVSGVAGADFSRSVVLVLGMANLIADGLSMGLSNYLGIQSRLEYERACKQEEQWELEHIPEEERKEIEIIYRQKGYRGETLGQIVDHVTSDNKRWTEEMLLWEYGIIEHSGESPTKSGFTTFVAFVAAGLLPLAPFLLPLTDDATPFAWSIASTGLSLFVVGALRSLVTTVRWWLGGFEMLSVGAIAASAAYGIGLLLKTFI